MSDLRLGSPHRCQTSARVPAWGPRPNYTAVIRPHTGDRGGDDRGEMSLRYIGSKARIADQIAAILGPWPGQGRFVDAFCGTGIVARHAADLGWPVLLNDHLTSSVAMASAQVLTGGDVP